VRATVFANLFGEQRRVDAAEDDGGATFASGLPDRVPAQRIRRVDADADDIARACGSNGSSVSSTI
jgi:hypothetical protein